ncbi:MAG: phosphate-binding protein [Candidatus Epulonipiscioides saccharophilum]|nr:MAG: phosphate-binding protein [Epulopiscium sp. AS2M-Bin001]
MKTKLLLGLFLATITGTMLIGCGSAESGTTIKVVGSTTVAAPMEKLDEAYSLIQPDINIEVQGVGSSAGVKAAGDGTADIGMASREIKESEKELGLNEIVIAKDAIAVVTHPANTVKNLTKEQVKDIFEGTITNWSEVGGADKDIIVICREDGSGTRSAFEEIIGLEKDFNGKTVSSVVPTAVIQEGNGAVKATVASKESGIGFVSLGYIDDTVSPLNINGVEPSVTNTLAGDYTISRPLLILTKGEESAELQEFIEFILGEQGQEIISENYIPVK